MMIKRSPDEGTKMTPILFHTCTDQDFDNMAEPHENLKDRFDYLKKKKEMKCLD